MDACKDCGEAMGTNGECPACLGHVVEKGAGDVDEAKAHEALDEGEKWLADDGKIAPAVLFRRVQLLFGMLKDYFKGNFKDVPWTTVASVAFGILYVATPIDLIPDFIPFAGYVDDLMVVGLVLGAIKKDLKRYADFKGYDLADYGF